MERQDLEAAARRIARKYGVPPSLFVSLIGHESGWNPTVVSPAGAIGLGQLMPGTARGLGVDPRDPLQNLDGAARYLASQLKRFGKPELALAAYNAGPGAVQKYGGIPPFGETQRYVRNVMASAGTLGRGPASPHLQPETPGVELAPSATATSAPDFSSVALSGLQDIAEGDYDPVKGLSDLTTAVASAPQVLEQAPVDVAQQQPAGKPAKAGGRWGGSWGAGEPFVRDLGLTVTSTKRGRKATASGGVSDHWTGSKSSYAWDLGGSVEQMDAAAKRLMGKFGVDWDGGPIEFNTTRNGFRFQILYRTNTGGNHFNHIHVGVRRVG